MKIRLKKKFSAILALSLFGVLLAIVPQRVLASDAPLAPSACTAVRSADGTSVTVNWNPANKDNADRYIVERRRNDGQWYWAGRAEAPATTFTDSTLRPQDSYKIRVYTRRADATKSGVRPCELSVETEGGELGSVPEPSGTGEDVPVAEETQVDVPEEQAPPAPAPTPSNPVPAPNPVVSSGPVPVPACGAYWGSYVNSSIHGGGSDAAAKLRAINNVEGKVGRTFDIDHQFYRWDDFATDHNVENYIEVTIAEGRIPFLSWKPVNRDNSNVSWKSISDGQFDAMIRDNAATVRELGVPIFMVFDHEANSRVGEFSAAKSSASHVTTNSGSEAEFVAAWRHVHDIFAQEGVTNVSWAWIMTRTPFAGNAEFADRLYPGDDYVDWVGLDPYNFFHGGQNWTELEELMGGFTNWVDTRGINKPWMLGEWGSVEDPNNPGRKGEWYNNAANYIASESRLKAVVHFESSPGYNWRIDSSQASQSAFTVAGRRPEFNQNC